MSELAHGVYVGLGTFEYFNQPRLGSTDLTHLREEPADWWYSSRWNPDYDPAATTDERDFGAALHLLVLEGEDAYDRATVVAPYPDFRTKAAREWLDEQKARGRVVLKAEAERRVRHMAALILNHPQYAGPLREGMAEVSVLFDWQGQPMRARIDYLLPQFLLDLKSYGGHVRGHGSRRKALNIVTERNYDIQRYLYDRAREAMIDLIRVGAVHGASPEQVAWLTRLADEPTWSWVWLFYQRRDDRTGRAPVVLPVERPRFDVTFDTGRTKALRALANYRKYVARFGLDTPWADIQPMWRPGDHEFPPWLADNDPEPLEPEDEDAA